MKKSFLVLASLLCIVVAGYSQKSNVNAAKSKASSLENPDFNAAKQLIEEALVNEETKGSANTWFVAGYVYETSSDAEFLKIKQGLGGDMILAGQDAAKAYEYYLKAYELDQLPNDKGKVKPKFSKKIQQSLLKFYQEDIFYYYGAEKYNKHEWIDAKNAFEKHTSILDIPFMSTMKELPIKDSLYYEKQFLAAQSAWGGSLYEDAVRIFSDLKGKGYQENKVYQSICEIYKNDINDTTSYFNTLLEGNNKFPQEFYYLGNIINHFMFSGQSQEAIKYLDMAIKENPNDAQLYNAYSSILEQQKDIEGAKKYIDQALVLDPNFADAWSTKGRLIYNQAFYKEQESFNASGKELKLLEEEFIKLYEESIPYFQKAIELNPNDFESMKTLKSLYYKLSSQFHINKYDELYNQMQERLNNF
ncbi:MAG: tetratricopeptide repeat protein [Bacteroidales bacterium]|nr:tetratricopeptide repeat protein [Bacteroidales bacterium]MDD5975886.1 tetratricopeptide repeat protein [Bacteroidales bacterium]MDY5193741.1 tetratricopeptide repeat protein [Candidatus Aphodosoma sp.]